MTVYTKLNTPSLNAVDDEPASFEDRNADCELDDSVDRLRLPAERWSSPEWEWPEQSHDMSAFIEVGQPMEPCRLMGPLINPASGLPIMEGSTLDVAGNPYCADLNQQVFGHEWGLSGDSFSGIDGLADSSTDPFRSTDN